MTRSLPERTVDAWVTAAIVRRFANARLWCPTQNAVENWDEAVGLGDGKLFLLENKAPEDVDDEDHRLTIDLDQLRRF